jgi:hypothetical protein
MLTGSIPDKGKWNFLFPVSRPALTPTQAIQYIPDRGGGLRHPGPRLRMRGANPPLSNPNSWRAA